MSINWDQESSGTQPRSNETREGQHGPHFREQVPSQALSGSFRRFRASPQTAPTTTYSRLQSSRSA
eukprot:2680324-Alexandrium_andersonii.AAC.1